MGLLDLPPELLTIVLRLCVNKDNVREALKQRLVCSKLSCGATRMHVSPTLRSVSRPRKCETFRSDWTDIAYPETFQCYLDDEILARMPVRTFTRAGSKSASTLLKNRPAHHLVYRVTDVDRLYGAQSFLPNFLKNCLELLRFMKVLKDGDDENLYALMLADQLVVACSLAYKLSTSKPTSLLFDRFLSYFDFTSGNQAVEQTAMAATVGCLEVVQSLKRIYGGGHTEIVDAIVADLKYNYRPELDPSYRAAFIFAIDVSLTRQHSEMSLFLIDQYHHYFPSVFKQSITRWLLKAAIYPDDRIYSLLTSFTEDGDHHKHVKPFKLACRFGYLPYVRRFFDNQVLHPDDGFVFYDVFFQFAPGSYDVRVETPLSLAIAFGNEILVEVILAAGADSNGQLIMEDRDRPLFRALQKKSLRIFALLMLWGSHRDIINDGWYFDSQCFRDTRRNFVPLLHRPVRHEAIYAYFADLALRSPDSNNCLAAVKRSV
ncbi:hypothetical protein G6011_02940 [Alternaria panax]|uniref:Uncharacterized protein n=1 Tax=Alternaria panax TaxID=48097 RepID=A0AAD4F9L1_9PLEO|nr:hypothetical protein G6011_02940 [Alternaria panax]